MNKYINQIKGKSLGSDFDSKCRGLLEAGAVATDNRVFQENLVCVMDNGIMTVAAHCYDEEEFETFNGSITHIRKAWFLLNNVADYVS